MSKILKATEVAEHKKPDSLWIIVEGDVYDVTKVGTIASLPPKRSNRRAQ